MPESVKAAWQETLEETGFNPFQTDVTSISVSYTHLDVYKRQYQDREELYERQRRKMHDYKNQLSTIQTLIKNGHTDEALSFTQKLTESIAVEMSAINTNRCV